MKQPELSNLQAQIFQETAMRDGPVAHVASWLLDQRNLEAAWQRVRSTEGANTPGVDGVTCADIEAARGRWLRRLADDLHRGRYRPGPVRVARVPKAGSDEGRRTLGILTVQDRVVHAALKQVLEPIFEPTFRSCSHGFRPHRSVATALQAAVAYLDEIDASEPYGYGARMDIADCFPSLDHELTIAAVTSHVADPWLMEILRRLLAAAGTRRRRWFRARRRGVIQGSPLSPLLCNILLDAVDAAVESSPPHREGGIRFLRYADDMILLTRRHRTARETVSFVTDTLKRLKLSLKRSKCAVRPLSRGLDWLGVRLQPRPAGWSPCASFGFVIPTQRIAEIMARVEVLTTPPDKGSDVNVALIVRDLNRRLRGWHEAYQSADNAPHLFKTLDARVYARIGALLVAVTRCQRSAVKQEYGVGLPRGFKTWECDGERVLVLSSLPPRCPERAVRKPAWQRARRSDDRGEQAPQPDAVYGRAS